MKAGVGSKTAVDDYNIRGYFFNINQTLTYTSEFTLMKQSPTTTTLLKVGQLSRQAGKSNRALRFYEEMGLISPTSRTPGGFRLYHPNALLRIQWIDRLQQLGFSLHEIREFLEGFHNEESAPAAMEHIRDIYSTKLGEVRANIAKLQTLETDLAACLEYLQVCSSCAETTPRSTCHSGCDAHSSNEEMPAMVAAMSTPAH